MSYNGGYDQGQGYNQQQPGYGQQQQHQGYDQQQHQGYDQQYQPGYGQPQQQQQQQQGYNSEQAYNEYNQQESFDRPLDYSNRGQQPEYDQYGNPIPPQDYNEDEYEEGEGEDGERGLFRKTKIGEDGLPYEGVNMTTVGVLGAVAAAAVGMYAFKKHGEKKKRAENELRASEIGETAQIPVPGTPVFRASAV
ncbi:hypothetical protein EV174_002692 [Coemansia sp. RSA 2320]|nr:hypothetical protein EV174_002692 [Coemansia sp. RSA 2320]